MNLFFDSKSGITNITLVWLLSFMNCYNMPSHAAFIVTAVSTKFTFVFSLHELMQYVFSFFKVTVLPNVACIRLLSFMSFNITFYCESCITNIKFVWLSPFINCNYVSFNIAYIITPHKLHICSVFPLMD